MTLSLISFIAENAAPGRNFEIKHSTGVGVGRGLYQEVRPNTVTLNIQTRQFLFIPEFTGTLTIALDGAGGAELRVAHLVSKGRVKLSGAVLEVQDLQGTIPMLKALSLQRWRGTETCVGYDVGGLFWDYFYCVSAADKADAEAASEPVERRQVYRVDQLTVFSTKSNPPRHFLRAVGTANTNARDAELVLQPSLLEEHRYELVAEHGDLPVLTEVVAMVELPNLNFPAVVLAETNQRRWCPPSGAAAQDILELTWSVKRFVISDSFVEPIPGTRLTAIFSQDGSVSGSGGCNAYGAEYTIALCPAGSIQVSNLGATGRYCDQPAGIMEQEARFFNGLLSAERYAIDGDELTLSWGFEAIVFDRAKG